MSTNDLPPPVDRFLRYSLGAEGSSARTARIHQTGSFRSSLGGNPARGWVPFRAIQRITADPPSFIWDARMRILPFLTVHVHDGYGAEGAAMSASLLGIIPVAGAPDGPDLREGALQRWLAESVWLPTALRPGGAVTWTPIDANHARASVGDAEATVWLDFEFAPSGEVLGVRAPARPRAVPGKSGVFVRTPWGGRFRRWEERAGMRVPVEAEVFWELEGREECYYRGTNDRFEYGYD